MSKEKKKNKEDTPKLTIVGKLQDGSEIGVLKTKDGSTVWVDAGDFKPLLRDEGIEDKTKR
jgi:hypothetical protein